LSLKFSGGKNQMAKKMSLKEEVRATMAEFAAAYEAGQRERLAALLTPEARLYEYKGHAHQRLGFNNALVLQEGATAYVDAKLEGHKAAGHAAGAPARLTAELERHGEQWRVKQMHYRTE
jgi:ketosteroid isomerase-like protein